MAQLDMIAFTTGLSVEYVLKVTLVCTYQQAKTQSENCSVLSNASLPVVLMQKA